MKLGNLELPSNTQKSGKDVARHFVSYAQTKIILPGGWSGRQQSIADVRSSTHKKINAWP